MKWIAGETNAQFFLSLGRNIAEESEREMHLFGREPSDAGDARIQPNEKRSDRSGAIPD